MEPFSLIWSNKPPELTREEKIECIRELMEKGVLRTEEVMRVLKEDSPSEQEGLLFISLILFPS